MSPEWRVVWRREGGLRRVRRVRNQERADAFVLYLNGRFEEATGHRRDEVICCSGAECGCYGETYGQRWDAFLTRDGEALAPLLYARVDYRPVGDWTPSEDPR